jgi:hypothetical protein
MRITGMLGRNFSCRYHIIACVAILLLLGAGISRAEEQQRSPDDLRLIAAAKTYERWEMEYKAGRGTVWGVFTWSSRVLQANMRKGIEADAKLKVREAHLDRMRNLARLVRARVARGEAAIDSYLASDNYLAEAEVFLADMQGQTAAKRRSEMLVSLIASASLQYQWWDELRDEDFLRAPETGIYLSERLLQSQLASSIANDQRVKALRSYRERSKKQERDIEKAIQSGAIKLKKYLPGLKYCIADATLRLADVDPNTIEEGESIKDIEKTRLSAAKNAYESWVNGFMQDREPADFVYEWSNRLRLASRNKSTTTEEWVSVCDAHRTRMQELRDMINAGIKASRLPEWLSSAADYYVADAAVRVNEARTR